MMYKIADTTPHSPPPGVLPLLARTILTATRCSIHVPANRRMPNGNSFIRQPTMLRQTSPPAPLPSRITTTSTTSTKIMTILHLRAQPTHRSLPSSSLPISSPTPSLSPRPSQGWDCPDRMATLLTSERIGCR